MKKIIACDIDGTICSLTKDQQYHLAEPYISRIDRINWLYDLGHTVIYWTARGGGSGKDFTKLTREQLKKWGARHHKLVMGKMSYDWLIDDKAFNSELFFK